MKQLEVADLTRAAETVNRFAQQQKDLVFASEMLTLIGSYHLSAQEAEDREAKATAALEKLNADIAVARGKWESVQTAAAKSTNDAKAHADAVLAEAQAGAQEILKRAKAEAESDRRLALANVANIKAAGEAELAKIRQEAGRIEASLAALEDRKSAAADELAKTEAKIAEARAAIAKALG